MLLSLVEHFGTVEDPRSGRNKRHKLLDIIVLSICAYVLAVKGNQSLLHQAIIDYFEVAIAANQSELCQMQCHEDIDAGHGRIETRRFYLSSLGVTQLRI